MKAKKPDYRILYIISAVEMMFFLFLMTLFGKEASDTVTYFSAWETLLSGMPDPLRTPVYPIIIGAARGLLGATAGAAAVCVAQCALFLCSISWFSRLAEALTGNATVAFWATAVYAVYPGPLTINCVLLTESLALSGVTGLLWLTYKAYTDGSVRSACGAGVVLIFLVLLRPALIFLSFIFSCFWLAAVFIRKKSRRAAVVSICWSVAAVASLGGYCLTMNHYYGIMTPSYVSGTNNYFTARYADVIADVETDSPALRQVVDSIVAIRPIHGTEEETWTEVESIVAAATPADIVAFTSDAIKTHPAETAKSLLTERLPKFANDDAVYGAPLLVPLRAVTKLFGVNIGGALALMLLFVVILARTDRRAHTLSLVKWLMAVLFLATAATSFLGAQGEWQRLMLPAYPALLIAAGYTLSHAVKVAAEKVGQQ